VRLRTPGLANPPPALCTPMGSYFDIREPFSIEVTHDHRKDGRGLGFKAGRAGISRALWFPAFERVALMSWKRDALKHRGLRSVKLFRVDPIQRNGNVTKTPREEKRKCFMDKNQLSKAGGDTRRDFIKKAATAAAAVATTNVFKTPVYGQTQAPSTGRVIGANDRLVVGFVVGNQGLNRTLNPCCRMPRRTTSWWGAVATCPNTGLKKHQGDGRLGEDVRRL